MLINNDAIRKMLIEVDADKITDEAAMKLFKILNYFKMEPDEDGWYTGTNDHCQSVIAIIPDHKDIFDCLTRWIFWNPGTGTKEDCIQEYHNYIKKWGN